ncbi:MAG: HD domain-containing protein [Chitinivibrionales bacterium]|nr:HD domain-containing protein [Chitinivibrionales bacterium]
MKSIPLAELEMGSVAQVDYLSTDGEIIFPKGSTITETILDLLRDWEIKELFPDEDGSLAERKKLNPLESFGQKSPVGIWTPTELKSIRPGYEGLLRLLRLKRAAELDDNIKKGNVADRPVGAALKEKRSQISAAMRNEAHKANCLKLYNDSVIDIQRLYGEITEGASVDAAVVRSMAERFVKVMLTDKDLLLSIASSRHKNVGTDYVFTHSLNVCLFSLAIATQAGYSKDQVVVTGMGALLHDMGMLLVPPVIRQKNGKLDKKEWYEIYKHPLVALPYLEHIAHLPDIAYYIAYQTHERENGKGYPQGRNGRQIHRFAKIVQIADVFEALTAPRNYRDPHEPFKAMELIITMSREGLLSGELIKSFLAATSLFPVGCVVELSDHRLARVVAVNETKFNKPVVCVLQEANGKLLTAAQVYGLDLARTPEISVIKAYQYDHLASDDIFLGF